MIETRAGPEAEAFTLVYRTERNRLRRVAHLMTGHAGWRRSSSTTRSSGCTSGGTPSTSPRPTCAPRSFACARLARPRGDGPGREPRSADRVDPPEIDETWDLLATLPGDQRVALVLRYYEDLPVDEIAHVMGCRPATARTRIHRALAKLREEMTL